MKFKNILVENYGLELSSLPNITKVKRLAVLFKSFLIRIAFINISELDCLDSMAEKSAIYGSLAHKKTKNPSWWLRAYATK